MGAQVRRPAVGRKDGGGRGGIGLFGGRECYRRRVPDGEVGVVAVAARGSGGRKGIGQDFRPFVTDEAGPQRFLDALARPLASLYIGFRLGPLA